MEVEKAIEILNKEDFLWHNSESEVIEAVDIILKELDNKDKQINEMLDYIIEFVQIGDIHCITPTEDRNELKQYFENKAKESK